ncbi:MAG: hypothetical protein ABL919_08325 [Methylococcales bacterium]|nr:hypothetical protein [Methylococcaceae bacterium]
MNQHPIDTTKPSRINRKRKKRWKISDLIANGLTDCYRVAILTAPCQCKVGIRAPRKGHKRPLLSVVFLYPSKRHVFSMVGCIEQPLKRLAGSFAGSSNLIQPAAQQLELVGGGLPLYKGASA